MTTLERWKLYYEKGWATKEHVKKAVQLGGLTEEEYEAITGEPYAA